MNGFRLIGLLVLCTLACMAAQTVPLRDIHKVFLEKMPDDLDVYLTAEITKQFKGRLVVVLDKANADAIMRGTVIGDNGVGSRIAGRLTGADTALGSIALVDKNETEVLWSAQAGDRSRWIGTSKRGASKVAQRLVSDLKDALQKAK
jgi:hypothetical protein